MDRRGGRPPYDPVLMFKMLILQTLYTLSDDATEFQIRDRLSFMRFLGLGFEDAVPDAKTVWLLREQLTRVGAIEELFAAFDAWLKGKGYLAMSGQIIDASIIAVGSLKPPSKPPIHAVLRGVRARPPRSISTPT